MLTTMTARATIATILIGLSMSAHAIADTKRVNIPAGELRQALLQVSEQFGADIVFSPGHVQGFKTQGAHGDLTTEQAITKLLEGTPLQLRTDPSGAMLVAPPATTVTTSSLQEGGEGARAVEEPKGKGFWSRRRLAQSDNSSPREGRGTQGEGRDKTPGSSDENSPDPSIAEVIVTGSHIRGAAAAGSKLLVLDRAAIEATGYGRVQDVLGTLTQSFKGASEEYSQGATFNFNRGAEIQLRGLGPGTTLTLVNGQRQAAGGTRGAMVDISSIATSAIERIEVLPEGSSAIYGSDAIGGVINIVLRRDYDGAETNARISSAGGEAEERQVSQLWGTHWSNGRVLAGYQFYEREPLPAAAREYTAANRDFTRFGGTDFRQFASNPGTVLGPTGLPIGAIPSGQDGTNLTPDQLITGAVNYTDNVSTVDVVPYQKHHNAFVSTGVALGEHWDLSLDGRWSKREFELGDVGATATLLVPASNAFNRFGQPVRVAYDFGKDLGPRAQSGTTDTYFGSLGLQGQLGTQWHLDATLAYADEKTSWNWANTLAGNVNAFLADSNPATALNVFGDGSHTAAATLDAIRSRSFEVADLSTQSMHVVLDGPLFSMPAGSVRLAFGTDLRREKMELRRDVVVGTRTGERDVLAVFSEFAVPLLASDSPLGRADLSVAGRYEDYEDFGTTFDPKVGLSWSPWEQLKLRGTWGTSFRAPPFHQNATTFGESVGLAVRIPDPRSPVRSSQVIVVGGNNPDLKEETADVWTAGLDWAVPIDGDLSVSLTYFSIDYQDKIGVPDALFGLLSNEATWAPVINRDPSQAEIDAACSTPGFRTPCVGPFAAIIDYRTRNLASVEVRGVDSELQYTLPSSFGSWRLGIRGTYNDKYDTAVTATSPVSERVNTVGSPLKLRLVGTIGWNWQQWTAATAVRYQNSYDDVTATLSRPVSSWTTLDLTLVYNVDLRGSWLDATRLSLAAINALDKEPPFVDRDFGYDGVNSTILGRQLAFQVTKSW